MESIPEDQDVSTLLGNPFFVAILVGSLLVGGVGWYLSNTFDSFGLPPGPMFHWPYIGEMLEFVTKTPAEFYFKRFKKYGSIYRAYLFGAESFLIGDAKLLRDPMFINNTTFEVPVGSFNTIVGHLNNTKDRTPGHAMFRKHQLQALNTAGLAAKLAPIDALVQRHVAKWLEQGMVSLSAVLKPLIMEIALTSVMGFNGLDEKEMQELVKQGSTVTSAIFAPPIYLPGTTWWNALAVRPKFLQRIKRHLHARFAPVAWDATAEHDTTAAVVREFQELGERPDSDSMLPRLIQNLLGGSETTIGLAFSTLVLLAKCPRVLSKVREEQQQIKSEFGDQISMDAVAKMTYLEAVIKESARLAGSTHGVWRRADRDLQVGKYLIPEGSLVMIPFDLLHCLDPACFDGDTSKRVPAHMDVANLEVAFQPERWLDPATRPRDLFTFGYGVHLCLGMNLAFTEIKCLISRLARTHTWQLVDPSQTLRFVPSTHTTKGPARVTFHPIVA